MKKLNLIILTLAVCFANLPVSAQIKKQFNKPIQSAYTPKTTTDARYNIGITGGGTLTEWLHFGGTNTRYSQPIMNSLNLIGGVTVERMLSKTSSVGVEALFALRNTQLNHTLDQFPTAIDTWSTITKSLNVNYMEVAVQVPYTMYFGGAAATTFRPYVFAAPRVSVPLSGTMVWEKTIRPYDQPEATPTVEQDTVEMTLANYQPFNVGLVLGGGILMRINLSNYYFLVKLDASYHAGFINTHTKMENDAAIETVYGASYIEPKLLGMRFSTDANLKLTLLFPLKKQLKGACMNWGEYD